MHRQPRNRFRFCFIGNEIISRQLGEIGRECWGWVNDAQDTMFAGECHGAIDRLMWDFKLQDYSVRVSEHSRGRFHIGGLQRVIGALYHDDAVLPVGIDKDGRDTLGNAIHDSDMLSVDAKRGEIFHRSFAEEIVANFSDHRDVRTAEPAIA